MLSLEYTVCREGIWLGYYSVKKEFKPNLPPEHTLLPIIIKLEDQFSL